MPTQKSWADLSWAELMAYEEVRSSAYRQSLDYDVAARAAAIVVGLDPNEVLKTISKEA